MAEGDSVPLGLCDVLWHSVGERDREELGDCETQVVEVRLAELQAVAVTLNEGVCEVE